MLRLDGRVALVTGAGQNIGAATARTFARQGAVVIVNDYFIDRAERTVAEITEDGGSARAVAFDITDRDAVNEAVSAIAAREGPIDILVNNAGNAGIGGNMGLKRFVDTSPDVWAGIFNVNLYGMYYCVQAVLPSMMERRFGRVITHTSGAGQIGLDIGVSSYGTAKAGQIGFMRHLAIESAEFGITCNTISVGLVVENLEHVKHLAEAVPLKRLGKPEDIANVAAFLASDESGYITGQVIAVNGGSTMN